MGFDQRRSVTASGRQLPCAAPAVQLNFDITPDGKRVIMFPQPVSETSTGNLHATFLLNFFDEVRRRVPTGKSPPLREAADR